MKSGLLIALLALAGCGYRALYAEPAEARLHVALVRAHVADATANDEVVSGVRTALARDGALLPGSGYPRVEVEVLRADEASEGIAAARTSPGPDGQQIPRARATQVGIVARAWIVRTPDGPHEADTGDVRAFDLVESPPAESSSALVTESMRHDNALRAVARRVGEKLAARVLGHPVARDESPSEMW
jgi:hypothetical protein